jgi:hypothetical protein
MSYLQQRTMLNPAVQFPDGIVKKTWAFGQPRIDDIKIEEVLQKTDLELAVLSAFQWDEDWILSKLNLRQTKVVCVVQADSEELVSLNMIFTLLSCSHLRFARLRSLSHRNARRQK